ncbi:unnamed protein product [Albugo candida]|uniref:Ubiquitin-like 1-activating enzyme E1A n=1 Tax=Albugo candida TaxID=65357 RepID=A0A024G291_9STRA|nr:unnamed protein product [Albugo candida]|eukprot:CCI40408.1 unnamed protein product [Albugo candida]
MTLSAVEAAVYDRQMRLWGVEAQQRLQRAQVLICGMSVLGSEMSKNLVLSGINVTLQDDQEVSSDCIESQFLFSAGNLGQNRAVAALPKVKELNPLVNVRAETRALEELDDSYFTEYSIVVVQSRLDVICRASEIAFLALDTSGFYASMFLDLGSDFTFRRQVSTKLADKIDEKKGWSHPCHISYPSFAQVVSTRWNSLLNHKKRGPPTPITHILLHAFQVSKAIRCGAFIPRSLVEEFVAFSQRELVENGLEKDFFSTAELSALCNTSGVKLVPVCAIMAGIAGREIVKIISQQDEPIRNIFLFDGSTGLVACIGTSHTHAMTRPEDTMGNDRNFVVNSIL